MRSPDPTDTGLELDLAGTADELVALVQQAVAASGADAQTTRHYVAIDGGTNADIRLRVVSVDDPAPLLAFAITTAPSARGTAAATFILQHGVQKKRRQRTLLGEQPFLAFLHALAALVAESDPGASATVRVHGARTVLAPSGAETSTGASSLPDAAPSAAPTDAAPVASAWQVHSGGEPAERTDSPVAPPVQAPSFSAEPVDAPPTPDVPEPASVVTPPEPGVPAAAPSAPEPERVPDAGPVVVAPPLGAPQFRQPPPAAIPQSSLDDSSTSSVAPELQITVPPGLIASSPPVSERPASASNPTPDGPVAAPHADLGATVVSSSSRAGDFSLELPDGERIRLRGPVLLGRNPSARPEQPDAELRSLVDPRMSVSKTHTAVVPGHRSLRVTDLHSTNGTTITDASGAVTVCQPGEAYVVEAGSTIGIGEFPIRVIAG
jgi:hypothetical protein